MRKTEPITGRQLAEFHGRFLRCLEKNGVDRDEFQRDFVQGGIINELLALRTPDWLKQILERERQCHRDFFGQEFDLGNFRYILRKHGLEAVIRWQGLGLEPHFLPAVTLSQNVDFPGWKVKPKDWYYQRVAEGKVFLRQKDGALNPDKEAYKLTGTTVLVDTRLKPNCDNGEQMFENDNLLGPIIEQLRREEKIAYYKYGSQSSRFGVSAQEWEESVKPALADFLKIKFSQLLFEPTIVANIVPQLYLYMPRREDGQTNTWMWYEEYFEDASSRFFGGYSHCGGLPDVICDLGGNHWLTRAFRSLVVLEN